MATISAKSLREKTDQELQDQLLLEKKRIFDAVVKSSSGESIKPHEKRDGRRLIARIQSILRERSLRKDLDQRISKLTPDAKNAALFFGKIIKHVEERTAAIKAELAKPIGERKVKPMPRRVRAKGLAQNPADRAALKLAEAKRVRAGLERDDVGQGK